MRQLFQNLIGNALKFQKPGIRPEIHIHGEILNGAGPEGNQCRIRVEDNGIGFENKYADQIFKVFERLHGRDEYEGTGIGLAVCRKVVERHRGTIEAEGLLGKGSIFTVTLPVKQK
jgi:signal transduction histidine kinase